MISKRTATEWNIPKRKLRLFHIEPTARRVPCTHSIASPHLTSPRLISLHYVVAVVWLAHSSRGEGWNGSNQQLRNLGLTHGIDCTPCLHPLCQHTRFYMSVLFIFLFSIQWSLSAVENEHRPRLYIHSSCPLAMFGASFEKVSRNHSLSWTSLFQYYLW